MAKTSFLYLTEEDTIKAGLLDAKQGIETLEEVFRLLYRGDYILGGKSGNLHGIRIQFPEEQRFPGMPVNGPDRRFAAMIAYIGGKFNATGCKWYGSNLANKDKGLPRSVHTIVLNNTDTGEPLAFMSGTLISSVRTGMVPAVAAKYTVYEPPVTMGLIGAGVINRATMLCMMAAFDSIKEVRVFDINMEVSKNFCKEMSNKYGIDVHPVGSMEAAFIDCDIIHMAVSSKKNPYIKNEWLKPGAVLELSGRADFENELLLKNNVILDSKTVQRDWYNDEPYLPVPAFRAVQMMDYENLLADEQVLDTGSIIEGVADPKYFKNGKPTIYLAMGIPAYDVAFAWQVYNKAKEIGIGTTLALWETPYWV